jgi:hypothetical protein
MNAPFVKTSADFHRHILDIEIEGSFIGSIETVVLFRTPTGAEIWFDESDRRLVFRGRSSELDYLQYRYYNPWHVIDEWN